MRERKGEDEGLSDKELKRKRKMKRMWLS